MHRLYCSLLNSTYNIHLPSLNLGAEPETETELSDAIMDVHKGAYALMAQPPEGLGWVGLGTIQQEGGASPL